jgi:hypothetical protein
VAELNALGGFWGATSLEPSYPGAAFYRRAAEYVYARQVSSHVALCCYAYPQSFRCSPSARCSRA